MFVHPGCIERISLLHQPRAGSTFDVFITGDLSRPEIDENRLVSNPDCMGDGSFPNQSSATSSQSPVLCTVYSQALSWRRVTLTL